MAVALSFDGNKSANKDCRVIWHLIITLKSTVRKNVHKLRALTIRTCIKKLEGLHGGFEGISQPPKLYSMTLIHHRIGDVTLPITGPI